MSFRKRNLGLSSQNSPTSTSSSSSSQVQPPPPGTRPSPIDGRPITSTGTPSLDALSGGHGGLVLGNSLLIEESGTTDFAGTLLRFYAAEGVVQGQQVHVVGVPEEWGRGLPGLVEGKDGGRGTEGSEGEAEKEKMKIAWRYERLGQFGEERETGARNPRGGNPLVSVYICKSSNRAFGLKVEPKMSLVFVTDTNAERKQLPHLRGRLSLSHPAHPMQQLRTINHSATHSTSQNASFHPLLQHRSSTTPSPPQTLIHSPFCSPRFQTHSPPAPIPYLTVS